MFLGYVIYLHFLHSYCEFLLRLGVSHIVGIFSYFKHYTSIVNAQSPSVRFYRCVVVLPVLFIPPIRLSASLFRWFVSGFCLVWSILLRCIGRYIFYFYSFHACFRSFTFRPPLLILPFGVFVTHLWAISGFIFLLLYSHTHSGYFALLVFASGR